MTTELTTPAMIGIGGRAGEAEMVLFSNKSEMLNHVHAYEHHNVNYYSSHHFVFVSTFSVIKSRVEET